MPYNYKTEFQKYRRYYQSLEPLLVKPRSKVYTTIIFSFLAVSLFGWYAIRPTLQTILILKREISDKTEVNKKMEDKITSLIEAQSYYQEVEPAIPAVNQALPPIPDAVPLLIQLRNLASMSGTLITAVQLPTVPISGQEINSNNKGSKQQVFDLSVAVRGTYQSIRAFLEGVTKMRRVVTIEGISIVPVRPESVGTASATLNVQLLQIALKFKAYYVIN